MPWTIPRGPTCTTPRSHHAQRKGDFIVRQCNARSTPLRILGMALVERCAKVAATEALHAALSSPPNYTRNVSRHVAPGSCRIPVGLRRHTQYTATVSSTRTQAGRTYPVAMPLGTCCARRGPTCRNLPIVRSIGACVLRLDGQGRTCVCVAYSHVAPVDRGLATGPRRRAIPARPL